LGEGVPVIGRIALCIVGGVSALYLAALVGLFIAQRSILFPAPHGASAAPPPGFAAARLDTEDELQLAAAYRRGSSNLPTILFFHGNGDSLVGADAATREIGAAGYGLLLVEYRGYAGNPGSPTRRAFIAMAAPPWRGSGSAESIPGASSWWATRSARAWRRHSPPRSPWPGWCSSPVSPARPMSRLRAERARGLACAVKDQATGGLSSAVASHSGTIASPSASTRRSSTISPSSG
jgi:hypothetical protein